MVELIRTNDPVFLSWLMAALNGEGIEAIVLDTHTSIMEGSLSVLPRRAMVDGNAIGRARLLLTEAENLANGGAS